MAVRSGLLSSQMCRAAPTLDLHRPCPASGRCMLWKVPSQGLRHQAEAVPTSPSCFLSLINNPSQASMVSGSGLLGSEPGFALTAYPRTGTSTAPHTSAGRAMKSGTVAMKSRVALTLRYHVAKGHDPPLLNHEELMLEYGFTGHCFLNICPPSMSHPL